MTDAPAPTQLRTEGTASLVDSIVSHLENAIILGQLPAGAKLTEQALASELGVSRSPLREALRRLEGRRLVVRTHNIGVRVAEMTVKDLVELLDIREALEGMAARLAAQNMLEAEIEELAHLVDRQEMKERAGEYSPDYQGKPLDFHLRVVRGSHSENLYQMLYGDPFYVLRVFRYRSSALPGRTMTAMAEHRAVVAAIAARQPDTAEAAMRAHLRNSHTNMLQNAKRLSLVG
ncbi:GntR family transcriptional regulator [Acuticoccus kandeliae]|uniref:GntR family transcriptional regulator n=1 Tax=Acuticoccus kandeliae TaxID=2073160 RepID=UPI001300B8B2|nr:GntR family transcriptional regulator [Acuticoccus kandeliae]